MVDVYCCYYTDGWAQVCGRGNYTDGWAQVCGRGISMDNGIIKMSFTILFNISRAFTYNIVLITFKSAPTSLVLP